ncbi:MAG: porin family protein [Rickettsiaceae bacterium]|nr:porin family protein [Rickettsiaceae bacterium]
MKKLLLITAITATNFSTIAQYSETNHPYIKGHIGIIKAQNVVESDNQYKSNPNFIGIAALGYNIKDNFRADLSFDRYLNLRFSAANNFYESRVRIKVSSLLLNFYLDVGEIYGCKMFLGLGGGASRFNIKITFSDTTNNQTFTNRITQGNEFTYGLYAGTHYELKPGIHGELMYSYKNLGIIREGGVKLKAHNITTGIRFDL